MSGPSFTALLFDLDGTLLDGSAAGRALTRTCQLVAASAQGLAAGLTTEDLLDANQEVWEGFWPELEDRWPLMLEGAAVATEVWLQTLAACDSADESLLDLAVRTHRRLERESFRLFDDVLPTLGVLKRSGIGLALVTNGAADVQRDKVDALGLVDWLDAIVISSEVGTAKPDRRLFDRALEELAVRRGNVWHVGDNLITDVGGAQRAGIPAVWLNRLGLTRAQDQPQPDLEIRSLHELVAAR